MPSSRKRVLTHTTGRPTGRISVASRFRVATKRAQSCWGRQPCPPAASRPFGWRKSFWTSRMTNALLSSCISINSYDPTTSKDERHVLERQVAIDEHHLLQGDAPTILEA